MKHDLAGNPWEHYFPHWATKRICGFLNLRRNTHWGKNLNFVQKFNFVEDLLTRFLFNFRAKNVQFEGKKSMKYLNFRAKNQIAMIFELVDKKWFLEQCVMTSKCRTKKTAKMMKMNFEFSTCIFLCFTNINACIFFVTIVIINACAALSINRKTTAFLPYLRRNYEG